MPSVTFSNVLRFLRGLAPPTADGDEALLARFVNQRDETAFEVLVRRHGPMVLNVCQRVVRNSELAEDCFQATFVVLARKAGAIGDRRALAPWLYGVAVRVARKARGREAQQRVQWMKLLSRFTPAASGPPGLDDLKPLLDEEVDRLPAKYRELIVLCYFQGKTNSEAARHLGCPEGTVFGRLARAREMLRGRLVRRRIALSSVGVVELLAASSASAALSPALVARATAAVVDSAALSLTASSLAQEVMRTMFWMKCAKIGVIVLALGLGAVGLGVYSVGFEPASAMVRAAPLPPDPAQEKDGRRAEAPDISDAAVEAAIQNGVGWIARQQATDGAWPGDSGDKIEGTALALLALLGSGETHKANQVPPSTHAKTIERGLKILIMKQDRTGSFSDKNPVAHALATTAVCEAYGLTNDPALRGPAQRALQYTVAAQHKGGWGAKPGDRPTLLYTSWQLAALKSGQMAGLNVPANTFKDAGDFLDTLIDPKIAGVDAVKELEASPNLQASLLRSRQLLGWGPRNAVLAKGSERLLKEVNPNEIRDMPTVLFTTELLHNMGGDNNAEWNRKLRTALMKSQHTDARVAELKGSWAPDRKTPASARIKTTTLAILSLEAYYRQLPLFRK